MTSAHQCFTYNPDLSLAENVICCGEDEVVQSRTHWSINVHETLLSSGKDGLLHVTILGGSDFSSFCWISDVDVERVNVHNGYLVVDDIILEVQGEKVAGYTQQDLLDFIWSVSRNHCPILLKTVSSAYLTKSLRQFLTTCLPKDSVDQNLQQVIRKNLYRKALPCTTRSPRQGEFDGVNYKFLTVEEFLALENSGSLLESGLYNGNYYGTPKPSLSIYSTAKANVGHMKASKEPGNISSDENVKKLLSRTDLSGSDSLKTRENNREGGGEGENEDEKGKDIEAENLSESSVATASSCNFLAQQHTLSFDDFAIAINSQCSSSDHSQSRDLDLENSGFSASSLTANDFELTGDFIKTQLTKSAHGLGFTIVSAGDSSVELLQIKSILPGGPADTDGQLHTGDVLVYVDSQSVFGFSHSDIINLFQSIPVGSKVNLEVCRGYSFYFDPDDPSTEVVTTVAVTHPATAYCHPSVSRYPCGHAVSDTGASSSARSMILPDPFPSHSILSSQTVTFDQRKFLLKHVPAININRKVVHEDMLQGPFELTIIVVKGADGFGFTITSSSFGQKIKQVIDSERCKNLTEGDILTKINGCVIKDLTHSEVVEVLKKCPRDEEAVLGVYRRGNLSRRRRQSNRSQSQKQKSDFTSVGNSSSVENGIRMTVKLDRGEFGFGIRIIGGIEEGSQVSIGYIVPGGVADIDGRLKVGNEIVAVNKQNVIGASHHQVVAIMNQSAQLGFVILDVLKHENRHQIELQNLPMNVSEVILTRKKDEGFGFVIISSITKAGSVVGKIIDGSPAGCCESLHVGDYILAINRVNISTMPHQEIVNLIKASGLSIVLTVSPVNGDKNNAIKPNLFHSEAADSFHLIELRRGSRGFGFSIRGGKEFDGMPLYILKIADEGPAKLDGRLQVGDQVIVINGCNTLNMMHSEAINLMQSSSISLSLLVKRSDCVSQEQVHDAYNWNSNSVPTETYEKIPWKKVERK